MTYKDIDNSKAIHIVLTTDNNYIKQCCVTILSILLNSSETNYFCFHIIHTGFTEKEKSKFSFKNFKNYKIIFYNVENFDLTDFSVTLSHTTITTYYRIFITKILTKDIKKIIYLDCDLIVLKDIKNLWEVDLENYFVGVVEDKEDFDYFKSIVNDNFNYFNAGVMLLNLDKLREYDFTAKCLEFYKKNETKLYFQDQDILNFVLNGKCKYLPISWNMQTAFYLNKKSKTINKFHFKKVKENPNIVHYTMLYKPWIFAHYHPMKDVYTKYMLLVNTPLENILFFTRAIFSIIFSFQFAENYRIIKMFNIPIYELYGYKRKIIRIFNVPIYKKFKVRNTFREYLFSYRKR